MNNITIKIKVQVLLIWVLKLCYGFLKLSGHSKEPELEFDKPLKRIALPRRHEFCMLIYPQRIERRVDGSLLALHLPYVSGFCSYFWRARTIYSPFNLFVFWQACGVCLGLVLAFLWSIADRHHQEQGGESCNDTLTDPDIPSLDGGWNWWINSGEGNRVCWIYLDNINMLYFFR